VLKDSREYHAGKDMNFDLQQIEHLVNLDVYGKGGFFVGYIYHNITVANSAKLFSGKDNTLNMLSNANTKKPFYILQRGPNFEYIDSNSNERTISYTV